MLARSADAAGARPCQFQFNGTFRRFVINRMGATGSTWLAKLLNSHPDVYCSHEGVLAHVYPSQTYGEEAIWHFLEHLAWDDKHNAYKAVGDVGSVWANQVPDLPLTTGLLLRHPARLLQTRLTTYPIDQAFTAIRSDIGTSICGRWGVDFFAQTPVDQVFLQDLFIFVSQSWLFNEVDVVIRIEDMADTKHCLTVLQALTGMDYDPRLVKASINDRVNRKSGYDQSVVEQVIANFTSQQQKWYHTFLEPEINRFGYSLRDDRATRGHKRRRRLFALGWHL